MIRILLALLLGIVWLFPLSAQNVLIVDKDIQLIPYKDSAFIHVTWHEDEKWIYPIISTLLLPASLITLT